MSKRSNEFDSMLNILFLVIVLPIGIIYVLYKFILFLVCFIIGDKYGKYNLHLTSDEREQLSIIDKMDGHEFEKYMAAMLVKNGFSGVTVTKGSGDFGADIIGKKDGIKYAFQCKRFDKTVGPKPIGEVLRGMKRYGCQKGVVITNNWYSKQAHIEGEINDIDLWDRNNVIELYRNTIKDLESKNKNRKSILDRGQIIRLIIVLIGLGIMIAGVFGIKKWIHNTLTKNITENTINYYKMNEMIYDIACSTVNEDEFSVELDKNSDSREINYIIKNHNHTEEEYDVLFKEEVSKVYEQIKEKDLIWNTIWGEGDCTNVSITFSMVYRKSQYNDYHIETVKLKYGDDRWKSSFESNINETSINQFDYDQMMKYIDESSE